MNNATATEKQISFINDLLAQHIERYGKAVAQPVSYGFPQSLKDEMIAALSLISRVQIPAGLGKSDASDLIDFLKHFNAPSELLNAQNRGDNYFSPEFVSIVKLVLGNLKPEASEAGAYEETIIIDDTQTLQSLAAIAAELDVLDAYYLARIGGELVLAVNSMKKLDQRSEFDYSAREYSTRIYRADGTVEDWVTSRIPKGENKEETFASPHELRVPVKRDTYEHFYELWTETGADETIRARRRARVSFHWQTMDLLDFSGGY